MTVPILTWHPQRVSGNDYATNDHIAFARDLETIHRLGLRVIPLHEIAEAVVDGRVAELRGCVGLSIDDGSDFDFFDMPHPTWGPQRGIFRIVQDFRAKHGVEAQPGLHVTTFTIVSPEARSILDRTCMIGCGWWNDDWWKEAESSGLFSVENHSWDHNHATLPDTQTRAPRYTFEITDDADAHAEVGKPVELLQRLRGRDAPSLFAYPYGFASKYLAEEWLPRNAATYGIRAAFTGDAKPVTDSSSRWEIPRFAFAHDWKEEGDLERLLKAMGVLPGQKRSVLRWFRRKAPERIHSPLPPAPEKSLWNYFRTWEVNDAQVVAGDLFQKGFGAPAPNYPRHFVLVYSPPSDAEDTTPRVVAYAHQRPFEDVYLGGGMVADPSAYRKMPKWLFEQVKREGGLATIVSRGSISMLGDSPASFGFVGEPRAHAADLRTGFVDTGIEHLMVCWRRDVANEEKRRLIAKVATVGPF